MLYTSVFKLLKPSFYYPRLRAPIASMDAMEDMDLLSGSNTHLSKLSSECNIMGGASQLKTTITAGLKYRHIGKTGLKVSNVALGMQCLIRYEMTNIP